MVHSLVLPLASVSGGSPRFATVDIVVGLLTLAPALFLTPWLMPAVEHHWPGRRRWLAAALLPVGAFLVPGGILAVFLATRAFRNIHGTHLPFFGTAPAALGAVPFAIVVLALYGALHVGRGRRGRIAVAAVGALLAWAALHLFTMNSSFRWESALYRQDVLRMRWTLPLGLLITVLGAGRRTVVTLGCLAVAAALALSPHRNPARWRRDAIGRIREAWLAPNGDLVLWVTRRGVDLGALPHDGVRGDEAILVRRAGSDDFDCLTSRPVVGLAYAEQGPVSSDVRRVATVLAPTPVERLLGRLLVARIVSLGSGIVEDTWALSLGNLDRGVAGWNPILGPGRAGLSLAGLSRGELGGSLVSGTPFHVRLAFGERHERPLVDFSGSLVRLTWTGVRDHFTLDVDLESGTVGSPAPLAMVGGASIVERPIPWRHADGSTELVDRARLARAANPLPGGVESFGATTNLDEVDSVVWAERRRYGFEPAAPLLILSPDLERLSVASPAARRVHRVGRSLVFVEVLPSGQRVVQLWPGSGVRLVLFESRPPAR